MSKIEAQIQELLLKKKKVEFLQHITYLVSGPTAPADDTFGEVRVEIHGLIKSFVDSQIELIEEAELTNSKKDLHDQLQFTVNEIQVLKEMVAKLNTKASAKAPVPVNAFADQVAEDEPRDPLRFAQKHRHLEAKRVMVTTQDGQVAAVVVGLDTPNIVVKTETGYTVRISPKNVQIIS